MNLQISRHFTLVLLPCVAGCNVYLSKYEAHVGDVPLAAAEDGQRVELTEVHITENDPSPWRTSHRTVLLEIRRSSESPAPLLAATR